MPKARKKARRQNAAWLLFVVVFFTLSGSILLFLQGGFDVKPLAIGGALCLAFLLESAIFRRVWPGLDTVLLSLVNFLCAVGMLMIYRLSPDNAIKQLIAYGAGIVAMCVVITLVRRIKQSQLEKLRILLIIATIGLLLLPLFFGKWNSGAKNWIDLGFFSLQPSEMGKVLLVIIMASYLAGRRRIRDLLPMGLFLVAAAGILFLQRDLGAVLIYFLTAILLYYTATSNALVSLLGLGAAAGGSVLGYALFDHVKVRVAIWKNPWASPLDEGYQIVQALMAIGSGGLFGLGLGLGLPRSIPAYHTDFIFAVICEEFGIIFGILILCIYALIVMRAVSQANQARQRLYALVSFGAAVAIALQTFIIVGGVIKLIPLTGVTMPFLSYGGSSMMASLMLLGLMQGVAVVNYEEMLDERNRLKAEEEL